MLAPKYLSQVDRDRLVWINDALSGEISGEGPTREELEKERAEIFSRQKTIDKCSFEELSELKRQLFDHLQKLANIGHPQQRVINEYIQQVEYRIMLAARLPIEEKAPDDPAKGRKRGDTKVSPKSTRSSWTVDFNKSD